MCGTKRTQRKAEEDGMREVQGWEMHQAGDEFIGSREGRLLGRKAQERKDWRLDRHLPGPGGSQM
jgi:hypothetical protein